MTAQARKSTGSAKAASAAKAKKAQPELEPTHRVIREIVIDGVPFAVDDLVALDGLNAAELESHGYVLKV